MAAKEAAKEGEASGKTEKKEGILQTMFIAGTSGYTSTYSNVTAS